MNNLLVKLMVTSVTLSCANAVHERHKFGQINNIWSICCIFEI